MHVDASSNLQDTHIKTFLHKVDNLILNLSSPTNFEYECLVIFVYIA